MDAMPDEFPVTAPGPETWHEVFADLADGNAEALATLYDLAASRIFGLALWRTGSHDDACDVVQDVFVRVAEQRERLRTIRDPRSWLLTVARRVAVDVVRRRKRRATEPIEERCAFLEAPPADAARGLDATRACALLAELPARQREVIYLHHHAGCTFSAIGDIVGCPTFTAASRYRLGIAKLRRLMETEGER